MFAQLKSTISQLQQVVSDLDPDVLHPDDAARLVALFSSGQRLCSAGVTLCCRQVQKTGVWKKSGEFSAEDWLAKTTGESHSHAKDTLETAKAVGGLEHTQKALKAGKLSGAQAKQIASAAASAPSFERELLNAAQSQGLSGLAQRCRQIKAASVKDEKARRLAVHKARALRWTTDEMGAFKLWGSFTPEAGAVLLSALKPLQDAIFAQARKQGQRDGFAAYAADALVQMAKHTASCDKNPSGCGPKAVVNIRVDHSALVRGSARAGETCEIAGVGPVCVDTVKSLAQDAYLKAVIHDATDVLAISHMGRTIPARLRSAITERDPECVVPRCHNNRFLEIDHVIPLHEGGLTKLDNLARLCCAHHDQKTYRGWRLQGTPGNWQWLAPQGGEPPPDWADTGPPYEGRPEDEIPPTEIRPGEVPPDGSPAAPVPADVDPPG